MHSIERLEIINRRNAPATTPGATKESEMYNWYYELNLPDLMHLIAEHDVEPDDADADMFLRRLIHQSVSFAADMIAGATITGRQVTIETTTNRTYTYTY